MILQLQKQDAETVNALGQIWLAANLQAHAFVPAQYWLGHYEDVTTNGLPAAQVFYACQNGQIQGFIGIVEENYIAGLFVKPACQRQGVGKELLQYCQSRYEDLSLHVYTQNTGAVRFYKQNGFVLLQQQPDPDTGCMQALMRWQKGGD